MSERVARLFLKPSEYGHWGVQNTAMLKILVTALDSWTAAQVFVHCHAINFLTVFCTMWKHQASSILLGGNQKMQCNKFMYHISIHRHMCTVRLCTY